MTTKEKTLADFDTPSLLEEVNERRLYYSVRNKAISDAYEAGKREATPTWISVKEKLPEKNKYYLVITNGIDHHYMAEYIGNEKWYYAMHVNYWLEIPSLYQEPKPECPCAQCGKELFRKISYHPKKYNGVLGFCNKQCAEDYEWVDAEFPRDLGKECRILIDDEPDLWGDGYNLAGFIDNHFIVSSGFEYYSDIEVEKYCQVRRDSVEGKC